MTIYHPDNEPPHPEGYCTSDHPDYARPMPTPDASPTARLRELEQTFAKCAEEMKASSRVANHAGNLEMDAYWDGKAQAFRDAAYVVHLAIGEIERAALAAGPAGAPRSISADDLIQPHEFKGVTFERGEWICACGYGANDSLHDVEPGAASGAPPDQCTCLSISRDPLCVFHGDVDKVKRLRGSVT